MLSECSSSTSGRLSFPITVMGENIIKMTDPLNSLTKNIYSYQNNWEKPF